MKLSQILPILEEMAPQAYAEDFDNVGLLVGNPEQEIKGILVCHDALENVIDEAIAKNCQLVVCFHPIIFSGLKKITGANYVERAVLKAIKNDIAIYAVHTALDNHRNGVNKILGDALGLENLRILIPKKQFISKLVTYVPAENAEKVRNALFDAGAGNIGNYENCSFNSKGIGTFMGNEHSNPELGERFEFVETDEIKIEVTFEKHLESKILKALFTNHPYEEVAYEIYRLENQHQNIGLGMLGNLPEPMSELDFLKMVQTKMQTGGIRYSALLGKPIERVAVLGGSGAFAISAAKKAQADAFITSDLKYHNFYEAENQLVLTDIGHFESERYTKNYIADFLMKKIPNFAIVLSEENTNPVKYL
ncbi:Nif3-like dinuclear metal center hexameric protein [Flavobacterium sp. CYK-55]|uniref:Nif3-like dinuclear metal center hexameric protein n=1 Tax=Flavobacterium sp. CYK-55 TaxID=2835529 RepID=UPI001BD0AF85|nr:Nif3-like dinuclear metal center hexameric protein [Flavobacterium sp. CYK-55]MBS7786333.1 Nif3-like dinuclear metal center hexameric protein [Flavobacterium sp. CYK-55]